MKNLWIDDVRTTPEGYDRAFTAQQAIEMLASGIYDNVSFDHDLGQCDDCVVQNVSEYIMECTHTGDGYQVICWLEERVHIDPTFKVPSMAVHSDNGPGRDKLNRAIASIERHVIGRK